MNDVNKKKTKKNNDKLEHRKRPELAFRLNSSRNNRIKQTETQQIDNKLALSKVKQDSG